MKLLELLARELNEWSKTTDCYCQDPCGQIFPWIGKPEFVGGEWDGEETGARVDGNSKARSFDAELATDHATAIVTRADWEAEKARIAGEETWLRHRGRKCPVQSGTLVDLKLRGGVIHRSKFCDNHAWIHTGKPFDVMYYRVSETDEQLAPVSEPVESDIAPDQILTIRNRIYELDTLRAEFEALYQQQTGEIAKEREDLVAKLKAEGLALVGVAVQVQSFEFDHADKSTWREGDIVEIAHSDNDRWRTRKGVRGQLNYDSTLCSGGWYIKFEDAADWCVSDNTELKFHSRPVKD